MTTTLRRADKALVAHFNVPTREDWGFLCRRRAIKARTVRALRRHGKALCGEG